MAINTIGTMELDELFASGTIAAHTKTITLKAGTGTLKRGQLIGATTADSTTTFAAIATGATAHSILAKDVTLSASGTVKAEVYVTGHFNANKVVGFVEATHYEVLRGKGIVVEKALAY